MKIKKLSMLCQVTRGCSLADDFKFIDRFSWLCIRLFLEEIKRKAKSFFRQNKGGEDFFRVQNGGEFFQANFSD